ncbi:MAG: hypothetical protein HRT93_02875 [Piscirickettsiaceae bacterium]|nr:hypothetical protein [Piscirickettsiaceae bacterium]
MKSWIEIHLCAMKWVTKTEAGLCDKHAEPDFYDVEVLNYKDDGSIETIEEHEDIKTGEEAANKFDEMIAKYPDADYEEIWNC